MQVHKIVVGVAALAVAAGIAIKVYAADETISLSQAPAAVQGAIKAQAADGKIGKIVKGMDDGKEVYEAVITKGGKDVEISFDPAGKLLGSEEKMSLKDVPKAVRKAIKAQAGTNAVESVEKATEGTKVVYEATVVKDGNKVGLSIAPDGTLAGTEAVKEKD